MVSYSITCLERSPPLNGHMHFLYKWPPLTGLSNGQWFFRNKSIFDLHLSATILRRPLHVGHYNKIVSENDRQNAKCCRKYMNKSELSLNFVSLSQSHFFNGSKVEFHCKGLILHSSAEKLFCSKATYDWPANDCLVHFNIHCIITFSVSACVYH